MIDIMLNRFIEHNQLFEFIEVYKGYLNENKSMKEQNKNGTTFLHFSIEKSATSIASYLLLDTGFDPNILSEDTQMGVLHMAVRLQRNDLVDLILLSELSNIDLISPAHGTPLHVACKSGNLKIV
jgi:ankyrin repeat protein